jgi:hypothetical protein
MRLGFFPDLPVGRPLLASSELEAVRKFMGRFAEPPNAGARLPLPSQLL